MKISRERLKEINNFPEVFTDPECPPLTDEQLEQLRPCHLVKQGYLETEEGSPEHQN